MRGSEFLLWTAELKDRRLAKLVPSYVFIDEDNPCLRIFSGITLARQTCSANTTQVIVPGFVNVVFTNPADAQATVALRTKDYFRFRAHGGCVSQLAPVQLRSVIVGRFSRQIPKFVVANANGFFRYLFHEALRRSTSGDKAILPKPACS